MPTVDTTSRTRPTRRPLRRRQNPNDDTRERQDDQGAENERKTYAQPRREDLLHRLAIGVGRAEIAGHRAAEPAQIAHDEWLIEPSR